MKSLINGWRNSLHWLRRYGLVCASVVFLVVAVAACQTAPEQASTSPTPSAATTPVSPAPMETGVDETPLAELTEPAMRPAPSPVGGTIQKVYIPGPESAVAVTCVRPGFEPFFYTDQGEDWVGCQSKTSQVPTAEPSQS